MNPYEWADYEKEDHFCERCGRLLSVDEFLENDCLCEQCFEELLNEEDDE